MKAIITVMGKDRPGIIASVSAVVFKYNANILDISQTVLRDEFFTMIMLIDLSKSNCDFAVFKAGMEECAKNIGMDIKTQREEIFQAMHRI